MTILTNEQIDYLIDDCGVSKFNSSFNDLNPEMSNKIRGTSVSERNKMIDNFHYISAVRKKPLRVETLLLKETIDLVPNIHKFLHDIGVRHHALEFLNPNGYATWDMMLSLDKLVKCVLDTYKIKEKGTLLELTCSYLSPCLPDTKKYMTLMTLNFSFKIVKMVAK